MTSLDHTSAPDIPPHVSIDNLSYEEVRSIVVDAVRSYVHAIADDGDVEYELRHRIMLEDAPGSTTSIESPYRGDPMRLSPGGRYLFIALTDRGREDPTRLQMYDLYDANQCFWSFKTDSQLLCFDFESRQDGSILVAVAHLTDIYIESLPGWNIW